MRDIIAKINEYRVFWWNITQRIESQQFDRSLIMMINIKRTIDRNIDKYRV